MCPCRDGKQTAFHILANCKMVPSSTRNAIIECMMLHDMIEDEDNLVADEFSILNCSRDPIFYQTFFFQLYWVTTIACVQRLCSSNYCCLRTWFTQASASGNWRVWFTTRPLKHIMFKWCTCVNLKWPVVKTRANPNHTDWRHLQRSTWQREPPALNQWCDGCKPQPASALTVTRVSENRESSPMCYMCSATQ